MMKIYVVVGGYEGCHLNDMTIRTFTNRPEAEIFLKILIDDGLIYEDDSPAIIYCAHIFEQEVYVKFDGELQ